MSRLIVNADDFGLSKSVNSAISWCFKNRIIDRTTLLVNMPSTDEAVNMAKENGFAATVGLHLNFVSGKPLLKNTASSVLCRHGEFSNEILKSDYYFLLPKSLRNIISDETRAQVEKFLNYGFSQLHMDSHHHVHIKAGVFYAIKPILKEYRIDSVRIAPNISKLTVPKSVYRMVFNKVLLPYKIDGRYIHKDEYMGTMKEYLESAGMLDGNVEIMVHPDILEGKIIDVTDGLNYFMVDYPMNFSQRV